MQKLLLSLISVGMLISVHSSIDSRKLKGKWQLNALYVKRNNIKEPVDLEKYSNCEKKSTLEFKDSILKSVAYTTFYGKKVWCFKDAKTYVYKINFDRDKTLLVGTLSRFEQVSWTIVALNDSILQLEDRSFFKEYKKIK